LKKPLSIHHFNQKIWQRSNKSLKVFVIEKSEKIYQMMAENTEMRANFEQLKFKLGKEQTDNDDKRHLLTEQNRLMQEMHVRRFKITVLEEILSFSI
jgi:hypothetical protein